MNADERGSSPVAERWALAGDPLTETVIGAFFEVSNHLGHGFLEIVYRNALARELALRGVEVTCQFPLPVSYKGVLVGSYFADMLVAKRVIVEVKALAALTDAHRGQVLNYLRASRLTTGLLVNFGTPKVSFKRVVLGA